ncbi:MAG: glycosyltransferase family 4 protein [Vicinamibacterales bacterium]
MNVMDGAGTGRPAGANRGRRVIYAWNYVEWGGAQVYLRALMREAATHVPVEVLVPEGSDPTLLATFDALGIPCETAFPATDAGVARTVRRKAARHLAKLRSELAMVRALGRRCDADVVLHVDLAPWQSMAALLWLARRAQVFVTCHTALPSHGWWREALWRMKFRVLSGNPRFHVLASNADARASLARLLPPEALARVRVTCTGVDPERIDAVRGEPIDASGIRRRFALPARPFLVACVGQFIDRKGRWTFLEAARHVAARRDDIGFVWLSNSAVDAGDRARIDRYGLEDRFRLLRAADLGTDHDDVFRLLRATDVFCLPTFMDGLPIALLEAMALGLPSVTTPVFAIPEAVTDGETGLLVPAGNAEALAHALLRLRDDAPLRDRLGRQGRAHVLARFDERASARLAWSSYAAAAGWRFPGSAGG